MDRTNRDTPTQKVLKVATALCGYAVNGVSNIVLAKQLGMKPPAITRAMRELIHAGWARKDEATGNFHPTPAMAWVFGRVLADLERAERALADIKRNFSRQ